MSSSSSLPHAQFQSFPFSSLASGTEYRWLGATSANARDCSTALLYVEANVRSAMPPIQILVRVGCEKGIAVGKGRRPSFKETKCRNRLLEGSREDKSDFVTHSAGAHVSPETLISTELRSDHN